MDSLLDQAVRSFSQTVMAAGYNILSSRPIAYGMQVTVSGEGCSIPVNIYSGKKGITITVGGSPTSILHTNLQALLGKPTKAATITKTNDLCLEHHAGFDGRWIGSDESGKGDFFGPLVVAAVLVDADTSATLIAAGIKDCKVLSDDRVIALAKVIRQVCHGRYTELILMPSQYNALYQQLQADGKNLNQLLARSHAQAIEALLQVEPCRFAIIDQFANEQLVHSELLEQGRQLVIIQAHQAERDIAVAAASILARECFLTGLAQLSQQYQQVFPKGAAPAVVSAGRKFVAVHGLERLADVAKTHFKTSAQLI